MLSAGLLLNNLSVYRGCEIVFDSSDVPDKALAAVGHGSADVQVSKRVCCITARDQTADALAGSNNIVFL